MNPKAAALHEKARTLLANKQGKEAGALLEQAIALMGDEPSADIHSDHGRALFQQGRTDEALQAFGTAIELDGENPKYRLNRAILLEQLGDNAGASEDLTVVVEAQPEREEVRWMLVRCLVALEDLIGAQVQLDDLLERNPASAPALAERARLHIKLFDFDAAQADLAAAEALDDPSPEVQKVITVAQAELTAAQREFGESPEGDEDGATELFERDADEPLSTLDATLGAAFLVALADGSPSVAELKGVTRLVKLLLAPELDDEALATRVSESMVNIAMSNRDEYLGFVAEGLSDARGKASAFLIAAAVGIVEGPISAESRDTLARLAEAFGLPPGAVAETLRKAEQFKD